MGEEMRRYFAIIIGILCIVFLSNANAGFLANSPGSEMGDAVFRPLAFWDVLDKVEHTGIYRNSDGRKDWDPIHNMLGSSWDNSVIQESGEGTVISWQDFETFKSGLWQKGRGYTKGSIETYRRREILHFARSQYGAEYPQFPDDWRWPYVMFTKEQAQAQGDTLYPDGSFRCDGLVEWSYDQIGMGSFSEEEQKDCYIDVLEIPNPPYWVILSLPTFYPAALRGRMTPEDPTAPTVDVSYDVDNKELTVFTDDGVYGSGIDWIGVYSNEVEWQNGPFNTFYPSKVNLLLNGEDDEDSDGGKSLILTNVTLSPWTYRLIGVSADRAGNIGVDTFFLSPVILTVYPPNSSGDVDINELIVIDFSHSMDIVSTEAALEIMNLDDNILVQIREINWEGDDKTMIIRAHDPVVMDDTTGFQFLTNYQVKIKGTAEDTSGVTLDGDKDGKSEGSPEDDYPFDFKTRNPKFDLSLNPWLSKVELGGTATIEVSVTNEEQRDLAVYLSHIPEQDQNWLITLEGGLNVPANETAKTNLIVKNRWNPGSINILVTGKSYEREHSASAFVWASDQYGEPNPPPAGCDENYSISNPNMPSPWILNPYAKVGILLSGYAEGMGHLLGRCKIPTAIVLDNFEILGAIERPLSDLNVLIIPTGGLIPYCNLPPYQDKLSEYVEQGGTLICFTQSYGYVFEALPGSPGGYGWREDKSCHAYACYLNLWDTFLSGQNNVIFDGNMDGYITQYPTNAEPFLIRIANGYPGFIRYPYYQGEVILTTCYTDFAYRFGGSFKDEMALIRDLITSYVVLDSITEFYKDSTVTLSAPIYYPVYEDSIPANKAGVITYYPNRESLTINQINLTPPMIPGDTQIISLPSISAPCSLGIYPIMFTLYQDTLPVTEEEYSNAFAVKCSIPVGNYNLGDFQIWTTVESESVLYGMQIDFDIHVRNNTADTLLGRIIIGQGGGSYDDTLSDLSILPDTVSSFNWETIASIRRSYIFWLYDSLNQNLGFSFKWIEVKQPRAQVLITSDLPCYQYNDTAHIKMEFLPSNFEGLDTFSVCVYRYRGWQIPPDTIYTLKDTVTYSKEGTVYSFPLFFGEGLNLGTYTINAKSFWRRKQAGFGYKQFNLISPEINLTLLPDTEITGNDTTKLIFHLNPPSYTCRNAKLAYRVTREDSILDTLISNELTYDTLKNLDTCTSHLI